MPRTDHPFGAGRALIAGAGAVLAVGALMLMPAAPGQAEHAVAVSAPAFDPADPSQQRVAILAGGCFWGMEAVFEQVKGVKSVTSGYAGGSADSANYTQVSAETTGHAEAVRIVYDPRVVSYGTLLRIYFAVAHDPTQLNRQGPDSGTSYRSAIFPQDSAQLQVSRRYIAQLGQAHAFARPIVTRIERGRFYPAESYHQDFYRRNPNYPYIVRWDVPKMAAFRAAFPSLARSR